MKAFTISAVIGLLAASAKAAPAPTPVQVKSREVFLAPITFYGAGGAEYTELVPTNDTVYIINNPLSVSSIYSPSVAFCVFFGAEGSSTVVTADQTVDVSPPQPQVSGICQI